MLLLTCPETKTWIPGIGAMFARALGWDKSNVTWYFREQTSEKNLQIPVIEVEFSHSHKRDDGFSLAKCTVRDATNSASSLFVVKTSTVTSASKKLKNNYFHP